VVCSQKYIFRLAAPALLIAAKYGDEKDCVPSINELNSMSSGLYDAGMFTQMEMHVLNTLEWNIGHPTLDFFQSIIWADEQDDREVRDMTAYLCEIALYHRDFVSTKPSIMARASHALARAILNRPVVNNCSEQPEALTTLTGLLTHSFSP
jgi:hypothetical protein